MKIPILHLLDGIHRFEETIESESLNFYQQEVYPHALHVRADVDKFRETIRCQVHLRTEAHYVCDRCLKEYEVPLDGEFELLLHVGREALETDEDNVVNLPAETLEFDLTDYITEYLILAVPMKKLCRESCKGICPGCGADLNTEPCTCTEKPVDPRWEKLRNLLQ